MHIALALPEIIEAILQSNKGDRTHRIYPCLLVTRLFWIEATRILWRHYRIGPNEKQHIFLVHLTQTDPPRAQFYASFIQALGFSHVTKATSIFSCETLPLMPSLDLPQLQSAYFENLWISSARWFLRPTLHSLTISSVRGLSDSFFQDLGSKCARLRSLTTTEVPWNDSNYQYPTLSAQGLLDFFTNCSTLHKLTLSLEPQSHQTLMDARVFWALSQLPNLTQLELRGITIDHHIISKLLDCAPKSTYRFTMFVKLSSLRAFITPKGGDLLFPYTKAVTSLSIFKRHSRPQSWSDFHNIIGVIAAKFSNLVDINIETQFSDTSFAGSDLVLLSKACQSIKIFRISAKTPARFYGTPGLTQDMDDGTIEEMARNLSRLTVFSLKIDGLYFLTSRSLKSLITLCRSLKDCEFSADISWEDLGIHETFDHLSLGCLVITSVSRTGQVPETLETNFFDDLQLKKAAADFASSLPNLESFVFNGSPKDVQFQDEVMAAMKKE